MVELSSAQLDIAQPLPLDIAVLTNIERDHMGMYVTMENYVLSKKQIFNDSRINIIGVDSKESRAVYKNMKLPNVTPFSGKEVLANGVSVIGNCLYDMGEEVSINYKILGQHNRENIACAYVACRFLGVRQDIILEAISNFTGLRHRQQFVCSKEKVTFINDSKATNSISAAKALDTYDNIYWIVGGSNKEDDFSVLLSYKDKIAKIYAIGETAKAILLLFPDKESEHSVNLEKAVHSAYADAKASDTDAVVMLSPACASFDQWKNFEERGDAFVKYVNALPCP